MKVYMISSKGRGGDDSVFVSEMTPIDIPDSCVLAVVDTTKPPLSCDAESRAYEIYNYRRVIQEVKL